MSTSLDTQSWTQPGAFEETPGVFRIPLTMPNDGLRAVNVYAIIDDGDVVVVDGGWATDRAEAELAGALDSLGVGLADVREYLITHAHRDHYTLAVQLRSRFGGRIAVGRAEGPTIDAMIDGHGRTMASQSARLVRAGAPQLLPHLNPVVGALPVHAYVAEPYELPDTWLDDGDEIRIGGRRLVARHTPGHTAGHMAFVEPEAGLLFSGDHVLPHITPSAGFEAVLTPQPLHDYLASLGAVAEGPDHLLLPAHGPAGGSAASRARSILAHHETRFTETLAACRDGHETAFMVAAELTWTRHKKPLSDLDVFNQVLAVIETLAHLDVLVSRGLATVSESGSAAARYVIC